MNARFLCKRSTKSHPPLFLRFALPDWSFYVYDSLTNRIYEIDEAAHDILEHYRIRPVSAIIARWQRKHSLAAVLRALARLRRLEKDKGAFSAARAQGMTYNHEDPRAALSAYDGHCRQLILEVTQDCNCRCRYCTYSGAYAHQRRHTARGMDWTTAKHALDWFFTASAKYEERAVTFYGGEPFLNFPLIRRVVDHVREQGVSAMFNLTTNGTLLGDPEIMEFAARNRMFLLVSLDGPASLHDRFRRRADGQPTHALIMRHLRRLHELYPEYYALRVQCAVTVAYPSDLPAIHRFFLADHGFPLPRPLLSSVEARDTDFYRRYGKPKASAAAAALYRRYLDILAQGQWRKDETLSRELEVLHACFLANFTYIRRRCFMKHQYLHMNGCCVPGLRRIFVEAGGGLHTCEKIGLGYPLGNVNRGGLDRGRVKAFIAKYVRLSFADCRECPVQNLCSLCFDSAMQRGRMTRRRKREACATTIREISDDLAAYLATIRRNPEAFKFIDEIEIV